MLIIKDALYYKDFFATTVSVGSEVSLWCLPNQGRPAALSHQRHSQIVHSSLRHPSACFQALINGLVGGENPSEWAPGGEGVRQIKLLEGITNLSRVR